MIQIIMISAIILVAYSAFLVVTITAIASLPPDMTRLGVPLGIVAGIVVLAGGLLI